MTDEERANYYAELAELYRDMAKRRGVVATARARHTTLEAETREHIARIAARVAEIERVLDNDRQPQPPR